MRMLRGVSGVVTRPFGLRVAAIAGVFALLPVAATSATSANPTPPKLPPCVAEIGPCGGVILKSPPPVIVLSNATGRFDLESPAAGIDLKHPVACGDAGCIYNHYEWTAGLPRPQIVSGCQANHPKCVVQLPTEGKRQWYPVLNNLNDYPAALYMLFVQTTCSTAHTSAFRGYFHQGQQGTYTASWVDCDPDKGKLNILIATTITCSSLAPGGPPTTLKKTFNIMTRTNDKGERPSATLHLNDNGLILDVTLTDIKANEHSVSFGYGVSGNNSSNGQQCSGGAKKVEIPATR